MTQDDVKAITPASRKVLDDYRDSLLGDGVSETARMLVEERISQMEQDSRRLKVLEDARREHQLTITDRALVSVKRGNRGFASDYGDALSKCADWLIAQEESDSSPSAPASTSVTEKE